MQRVQAIKTILASIPVIALGKFTTSKTFAGQEAVKEFARDYGRPFDLAYTFQAIAWQESSYGVNMENPQDPGGGSFGYFGITIQLAVEKLPWLKGKDVDYVIDYIKAPEINAYLCLRKLITAECFRRPWLTVWMRFNGNDPQYARDIQAKIAIIKANEG